MTLDEVMKKQAERYGFESWIALHLDDEHDHGAMRHFGYARF